MTNRLNDKTIAGAIAGGDALIAIVGGLVRRIAPATLINLYRGAANGVAALDGSAKLSMTQMPAVVDLTGNTVQLPLGTTFGGTALSPLIASIANLPIGTPLWWPTDTVPAGYLARDGALISRTTYAALFDVLVTQPGFTGQTFTNTIASPGLFTKNGHGFSGGERLRLTTTGALATGLVAGSEYFVIVNDVNTFWLATSEANAAAGTKINTSGTQSGTHTYTRSLYGLGDGATTFGLPDDRDLFVRGKATSGRVIGGYQADALQGHWHDFFMGTAQSGLNTTNAIGTSNGLAAYNPAGTPASSLYVYHPSSDGINGAPRTGSQTRPVNRAYLPIIKYA